MSYMGLLEYHLLLMVLPHGTSHATSGLLECPMCKQGILLSTDMAASKPYCHKPQQHRHHQCLCLYNPHTGVLIQGLPIRPERMVSTITLSQQMDLKS